MGFRLPCRLERAMHFDHTSGNEWLHSVGAKIIAHKNRRKHLSEIQRVEDWDYNFLPLPSGAIPSELLSANRKLKLSGASIGVPYQGIGAGLHFHGVSKKVNAEAS